MLSQGLYLYCDQVLWTKMGVLPYNVFNVFILDMLDRTLRTQIVESSMILVFKNKT